MGINRRSSDGTPTELAPTMAVTLAGVPSAGNPITVGEDGRLQIGAILGAYEKEYQSEGAYEILGFIDSGGMGCVYRARHTTRGIVVAVKVMHPKAGATPQKESVARFLKEARMLMVRFNHPHVVRVSDAGVANIQGKDNPFFAMEYLEGEPLAALLDREQHLSIARAVAIAAQVCEALHAAHTMMDWEEGGTPRLVPIVHRDLKPENIYLVRQPAGAADFVKVLDFGIAKDLGDTRNKTVDGMIMGTPVYMSPEQAEGRSVTPLSDMYSLGQIVYELLTGMAPDNVKTDETFTLSARFSALLKRKLYDAPVPLIQARPDVSQALSDAVMKAIAKEPEDRFASVEEFRAALLAAVETKPSPSPLPKGESSRRQGEGSVTAPQDLPLGNSRITRALPAVVIAVVALGVITSFALRPTRSTPSPAPTPVVASSPAGRGQGEGSVPALQSQSSPQLDRSAAPRVPPSGRPAPALQREKVVPSARTAPVAPKAITPISETPPASTVAPSLSDEHSDHSVTTTPEPQVREESERKAKVEARKEELRKQIVALKAAAAMRRNMRNSALSAKIDAACRELGGEAPECK